MRLAEVFLYLDFSSRSITWVNTIITMQRKFPRFLLSDPQNTKSKGPFITHTLYPKAVMAVLPPESHEQLKNYEAYVRGLQYHICLLEIDTCTELQKRELLQEVDSWFNHQPESSIYKVNNSTSIPNEYYICGEPLLDSQGHIFLITDEKVKDLYQSGKRLAVIEIDHK